MRAERADDDGSAVVEFALLLPILLLVLLALVQVGVLASHRLALANAARAAAREAAVDPAEESVRRAAVAAAAGLDDGGLHVTVVRAGTRGDPVTVTVRYEASVAGALAGWLLPASVAMTASATARQEFG